MASLSFSVPSWALPHIGPGWSFRFYELDSSTPKTIYQDSGLTTAHILQVRVDRQGHMPTAYIDDTQTYRVTAENEHGVYKLEFAFPESEPVQPTQPSNFNVLAPRNFLRETIYPVDTNSGAVTGTMTGNFQFGDRISFTDESGTFAANGFTLNFGSHNFRGLSSQSVTHSVKDAFPTYRYIDANYGFGSET